MAGQNPYKNWHDDLVILHISDLHAGAPDTWWCRPAGPYGKELRYEIGCHQRIIEALQRLDPRVDRLDAIVVSGDITHRAAAQEFEAAQEFLSGLCATAEHLFGRRPSLVLAPGNHDVSWPRDRAATNEGISAAERDDQKLEEYTAFAKRTQAVADGQKTHWVPLPLRPDARDDSSAWIVALSSCVREGHEDDQHYGYIGYAQLEAAFRERDTKVRPHDLQLAVFHHAVSLNTPTFPSALAEPAGGAIANQSFGRFTNVLQGSEATLRYLSSHGVRAVLHGHQHYDWPLHTSIPVEDPSNPWEVGGITMFGAGCSGLEQGGGGQVGPTGFLVLRFYNLFYDWEAMVHRIPITAQGRFAPHLKLETDEKPYRTPLLSVRSHAHYRELLAMASSLVPKPEAPPCPELGSFPLARIERWPRLRLVESKRPHVPASAQLIAYWCTTAPYNRVVTYGPCKAGLGDGRLELDLAPIHMAEAISSWLFASQEKKSALLRTNGLAGIIDRINRDDFGAARLGIDFAGLVRKDEATWLIVHRRSEDVGWQRGELMFTAAGGIRDAHLSKEELRGPDDAGRSMSLLETAARREIRFEIGLEVRNGLDPVAIYFDMSNSVTILCAGWLDHSKFVLECDDSEAAQLVRDSGHTPAIRTAAIKLESPGRDQWESKRWYAVGCALPEAGSPSATAGLIQLLREIVPRLAEARGTWLLRTILSSVLEQQPE